MAQTRSFCDVLDARITAASGPSRVITTLRMGADTVVKSPMFAIVRAA
jgi:hypothetical protein